MSILWNQPLKKETYQIYGARFYNNIYGHWNEYFSDLKVFTRISKLLVSKYKSNTQISNRTILNNYISLANVFTESSLARLAFFLSNPLCYSDIKTILFFIHRLPNSIPEIDLSSIPFNTELLSELCSL